MGEEKQDKPKIIVDDDWKAQAQAEKQRLAEAAEKRAAEGGEAAADEAGATSPVAERGGRRQQIPPASFSMLVQTIVTQALYALGGFEDPKTHKRFVDLDLAKHHVDTLVVLEDKTRGNLSDEEKKVLDQALYEVRMAYVQVAQSASRF